MSPGLHRRRRFFRGSDTVSGRPRRYRPVLECLEGRCVLSGAYTQVNLASDVPGLARVPDPHLVNPWGISFSPTGPFWFADNGSGVSDILDGRGQPVPLVVTVPPTAQSRGTPTGTVFNGGPGFSISENGVSAPSRFLFATEDGTIAGWTEVVDPTRARLAVDNSSAGAVYKGLALAVDPAGQSFLYAADFGRGRIDVFDQDFKPVARPGSFQDPNLPDRFAPFNIQNINNLLFVTYAQPDEGRRDDVAAAGHGFIDVYDTGGNLVRRFASQGALNSPWGLALAPTGFGPFGGTLLVGNFGDGRINAYDPGSGAFLGSLADDHGMPITILDLWALTFGNGHAGGSADTLFFAAGVDHEQHGLFGAIQAPQRKGADTAGPGSFDPDAPGEPDDYPFPPRGGPALRDSGEDARLVTAVLLPLTESSLALVPTLSAVPPSRAQVGAPAPASPVVADSSQRSIGAAVPASSATRFAYNSLALNAFLDVNAAPIVPENPARGQRAGTTGDAVGARRSTSAGGEAEAESLLPEPDIEHQEARSRAEQGPELPPPPCQADKVLARVPSQGRPESARDRTAESEGVAIHDRRSWTELLNGLLVAVSIPVVWVICRGPGGGHASHPGKIPRRAWRQGVATRVPD